MVAKKVVRGTVNVIVPGLPVQPYVAVSVKKVSKMYAVEKHENLKEIGACIIMPFI